KRDWSSDVCSSDLRQALRSKTGASNQDRYQLSKTATGSISSPSALWSGLRRGNRPRAPILIAPLRRNRDVTNQFYYRVGSVMPVTTRALHKGCTITRRASLRRL